MTQTKKTGTPTKIGGLDIARVLETAIGLVEVAIEACDHQSYSKDEIRKLFLERARECLCAVKEEVAL